MNAWIANVPCCSVASVRKRLQASGIERSRSTVQEYVKAEHWPANQVMCVEILVFLCHFFFCGPPTGEESAPNGAEQAALLEWCTSLFRIVPLKRHSAKTRLLACHLTLRGTLDKHRQHLPSRNGSWGQFASFPCARACVSTDHRSCRWLIAGLNGESSSFARASASRLDHSTEAFNPIFLE